MGGKATALVCEKTTTKVNTRKNCSSAASLTLHCPLTSATSFPNECLMRRANSLRVTEFSVPSESQRVWRNPYHLSTVLQWGTSRFSPSMDQNLPFNRTVRKCELVSNLGAHRSARPCCEGHDFLVLDYRPLNRRQKAAFKVVGDF